MSRKRTPKDIEQLFTSADSQAAGYFEPETHPTPQRTLRIVAVPLSQCLPDRFQARVILPQALKARFYSGELDCYQTAANLLMAAQGEAGLGRQVEQLLELGENILELGQIEPATGSWVQTSAGAPVFALEVGERRFWGLALAAVQHGLAQEPQLKVIEEGQFSRERQISENIQREGNTAVDRARAVAGLILLQLGRLPDPELADDLDYFRQVLSIRRLPSGTWAPIEKKMRLSRPALERHLQILRLPGELIYQAKLYDVPEGRLREIISAPADLQAELLRLAIEADLNAQQIKEQAERKVQATPASAARQGYASTHRKAAGRLRSFLRLVRRSDFRQNFEMVATEFSVATEAAEELLEAATRLEEQAHWLRVVYDRRR
jgi:hypothetical protein